MKHINGNMKLWVSLVSVIWSAYIAAHPALPTWSVPVCAAISAGLVWFVPNTGYQPPKPTNVSIQTEKVELTTSKQAP